MSKTTDLILGATRAEWAEQFAEMDALDLERRGEKLEALAVRAYARMNGRSPVLDAKPRRVDLHDGDYVSRVYSHYNRRGVEPNGQHRAVEVE